VKKETFNKETPSRCPAKQAAGKRASLSQGNLQLGTSTDEGCLERSERNPALIALAYESGLGEKNSLGFGMLEVEPRQPSTEPKP
jgi:CRISPR/Cas system endoribonuclease Cas6 (RAMP superfamily)